MDIVNTEFFTEFAKQYKNLVFIGEAGSGKTELALNIAQGVAQIFEQNEIPRQVHLFDMDQTKANLRARDVEKALSENGVFLHYGKQILDTPTVASGTIEHLEDPNCTVIMDIGGGTYGAHMIGQFSEHLSGRETAVMYVFNPYRPWSLSRDDVAVTMESILSASRLTAKCLICNPNLGPGTTLEEYMEGYQRMCSMFPETPITFCCASETIFSAVEKQIPLPVYPIKITVPPEWMYDFD